MAQQAERANHLVDALRIEHRARRLTRRRRLHQRRTVRQRYAPLRLIPGDLRAELQPLDSGSPRTHAASRSGERVVLPPRHRRPLSPGPAQSTASDRSELPTSEAHGRQTERCPPPGAGSVPCFALIVSPSSCTLPRSRHECRPRLAVGSQRRAVLRLQQIKPRQPRKNPLPFGLGLRGHPGRWIRWEPLECRARIDWPASGVLALTTPLDQFEGCGLSSTPHHRPPIADSVQPPFSLAATVPQ